MADPFTFIASFAVGALISYLFPSQGPRMTDLSVSASTYGNPIPWVWGDVRVGGNMIWSSKIIEHKHKKKAGIGQYYNQYTYSANFAMAFCKGPAQSIHRMWANGKLIFDASGKSKNATKGTFKFQFYTGTEDQMPDPTIAATIGLNQTPPYRGTVYVVFTDFDLSNFGNQIPQIAAEIYLGPQSATPFTYFNNGDPTTAYTNFYAGTMTVDYVHGFFYTNNNSDRTGIAQWDLATGAFIRDAVIFRAPEDTWDSGYASDIFGVNSEGDILVNLSGTANMTRIGLVDKDSLEIKATIGHGAPWELDSLAPPWIAYLTACFPSTTNERFLGVTYNKDLYILDGKLEGVSAALPKVGDLYHAFTACGIDAAAWVIAYNGTDSVPGTSAGTGFRLRLIGEASQSVAFSIMDIPNPDATTSCSPVALCYDQTTNSVIVFYETPLHHWAAKISLDLGTVTWNRQLPGGLPWQGLRTSNLLGGTVAWFNGASLFLLNTSDGSMINRNPDQATYTDNNWINLSNVQYTNPGETGYPITGPGFGPQYFDGVNGSLVVLGNPSDSAIIHANQYGATAITLDVICTDLFTAAGLAPDQYDVSNLSGQAVRGYGFAQTSDIKNLLGELQQIFLFDLFEQDGKIVGKMRGDTGVTETISYKALGNSSDGSDGLDFWKETRLSEADIPASVNLKYMNVEQDFEQSNAVSKRISNPIPTMFSKQQDTVEAAIAFDPTEAKIQANKMLYVAWGERIKHTTRLPLAYAYLTPSDLLTVNLADGRSYFDRISMTEFGADFSTVVETHGQDSGAYTQTRTGDGGTGHGQTIQSPAPAQPFIFNMPYLRDVDATGDGAYSIYYDGVGNMVRDSFGGATLFTSLDGGSYDILNTFQNDLEYGSVTSGIVPDAANGTYAMDWKTKITIYPAVTWFNLEPVTDDELANGANVCVVGDEVIQFRDAVQNTNGSWTISNLLRGRRGTEWACSTHKANEYFVFLNTATMAVNQEPLDSKGKTYWYKAVGTGMDVATAKVVKITYVPRDLMPYAPVQVSAAWDVADLKISFQRRTRFGGNMQDGTGVVPLNEKTEAYEVDVYDGSGNVIRTLSTDFGVTPTANPFVNYPAVMIAEDFSSAISQITVAIYQMGIVGRGFGTKATLGIAGTASPTSRFWGASANTTLTETEVETLGFQDLSTNFTNSVTYDCTGGKYPYYAYPASFGTPSHVLVNSLPFSDFTVSTQTVAGISFKVIRFNRIQHGTGIPVTWQ
jgi:hypothetical protein